MKKIILNFKEFLFSPKRQQQQQQQLNFDVSK